MTPVMPVAVLVLASGVAATTSLLSEGPGLHAASAETSVSQTHSLTSRGTRSDAVTDGDPSTTVASSLRRGERADFETPSIAAAGQVGDDIRRGTR